MNNQIFLQPDLMSNETHEDDVLHSLIQAQLNQSLAEIEALINVPPKPFDEQRFSVSHSDQGSGTQEAALKTWMPQRFISLFTCLVEYVKSAWFNRA